MTLGLLDLSIVTDRLLKQLNDCATASTLWDEERSPPEGTPDDVSYGKFTINFTGVAPDAAQKQSNCNINLYLFHVAPDAFHRNTFPLGGRPHEIPQQPLALTLYYLLSAHSENYIQEQQAMSIALKCLHEHAVVKAMVPKDGRTEEFTLTMEPHSVDEIGRLWLSIASPLRLSAVYRASVIFLEPVPTVPPHTELVLRPDVKAKPFASAPPPVVLTATVTRAGLATITGAGFVGGAGFVAESIDMQIGSLRFPLSTNAVATEPGRFRVVDPTTIELRFPSGTPTTLKGRYLLHVRLGPEQPATELWLNVP